MQPLAQRSTRHPLRWARGARTASPEKASQCLCRLPMFLTTRVPRELQDFLLTSMDEGLARSSARSSAEVTAGALVLRAASRVSLRWQ